MISERQVLRFPNRLLSETLEVVTSPIRIAFSAETLTAVRQCRSFVECCIRSGRPVYGATTGYGALVGYSGRTDGGSWAWFDRFFVGGPG
jgi:histidine ammonia-lyase